MKTDSLQLLKLNNLISKLWEDNPFYAHKWSQAHLHPAPVSSLDHLASFPFTTRSEFIADQIAHPPLGSNLTARFEEFKRFHRSSGTTLAPLIWADTTQSWKWLLTASEKLFRIAAVTSSDRIFFTKPLGPSLGPWITYEAALSIGAATLNACTTEHSEQIAWLKAFRPTIIVGKPEALKALAAERISPGAQKLILTGPADSQSRAALENQWHAPAFDRYGLTEAGSVAGECAAHSGGLHLLDDEFIAEAINPKSKLPAGEGELGELVLTTLGRIAHPIVRYLTGDLVQLVRNFECPCGLHGTFLKGGIERSHRA